MVDRLLLLLLRSFSLIPLCLPNGRRDEREKTKAFLSLSPYYSCVYVRTTLSWILNRHCFYGEYIALYIVNANMFSCLFIRLLLHRASSTTNYVCLYARPR